MAYFYFKKQTINHLFLCFRGKSFISSTIPTCCATFAGTLARGVASPISNGAEMEISNLSHWKP